MGYFSFLGAGLDVGVGPRDGQGWAGMGRVGSGVGGAGDGQGWAGMGEYGENGKQYSLGAVLWRTRISMRLLSASYSVEKLILTAIFNLVRYVEI